jgi:hypothetical protein
MEHADEPTQRPDAGALPAAVGASAEPESQPEDLLELAGVGTAEATSDQGSEEARPVKWKVLAYAIGGVIVLALGAYAIFGGSDNSRGTHGRGNGNPNATANATIRDDFSNQSTSGLGKASTGQAWETPLGVWGASGGSASIVKPNGDGAKRNIAVISLGSSNGSVSAVATKMTPSWSLIFRYRGPQVRHTRSGPDRQRGTAHGR